jgi:NADPH-dependent 2,4-dienoyl-CoA reductase/sulfur reductase-like enzyme
VTSGAVAEVDALVVGAGPAGLAAAAALARAGVRAVAVDREAELGGIPRHTDHLGYGVRAFRRLLRGPAYARAWVDRAARAGVDLRPATTVTGWAGGDAARREVTTTSPAGTGTIRARALLVATGTRERPRPARLVPGARPAGVLTTGALPRSTASSPSGNAGATSNSSDSAAPTGRGARQFGS